MKLPKALLIAVLAGAAAAVAEAQDSTSHTEGAFVVKKENIIDITSGSEEITDAVYNKLTDSSLPEGSTNTSPIPIVKDGQGTLKISDRNSFGVTTPFVVREGTVKISNTAVTSKLSKPNNFVPYIAIGGNNATLELDRSSITHYSSESTNYAGALSIGTPDGSGTVKLTNKSTLHTDHFFFAGDPDGQRYNYTGEIGTGYGKFTENYSKDETTEAETYKRYEGGSFNTRTTITAESGSVISAGTSFQLSDVDIVVSGDGSKLMDNTRALALNAGDRGSFFGYERTYTDGITTDVTIKDGADFDCNWSLYTGGYTRKEAVTDANRNRVNISIEGKDKETNKASTFSVNGLLALGDNTCPGETADATSETNLSISGGAKAEVNVVTVGKVGKATITVGEESSITANANAKYNTAVTGDSTTPVISIYNNGILCNAGTIAVDTIMTGGQFIAKDGSSMASLEATGGEFQVGGSIDAWGDIALTNAEFIFADGAVIDLNGKDFTFGEGSSITIIMSGLETQLVMLADADSTYEIQGITFNNAGSVTGLDRDLTVTLLSSADADPENALTVTLSASKVTVNPVPEPTTATLSLLALAGLAARRRRK